MSGLSCLTESTTLAADIELRLNRARHDFLKHAMLEWCELEAPVTKFEKPPPSALLYSLPGSHRVPRCTAGSTGDGDRQFSWKSGGEHGSHAPCEGHWPADVPESLPVGLPSVQAPFKRCCSFRYLTVCCGSQKAFVFGSLLTRP